MAVFNVYLVDILNLIGTDDRRSEVTHVLKDYFDAITKKAGVAEGSSVQFVTANPQAAGNELICYYIGGPTHIVTKIDGAPSGSSTDLSHGGMTIWGNSATGSDVVANGSMLTRFLANITFHEFMHNKLHMGESMHSLGGLAAESVDDTTAITQDNISRMAKALKTTHAQWGGGFDILNAIKAGDPLAGL